MWYWECFTPHPPIIIPQVGGGREQEASDTIEGMKKLSELTGRNAPDNLLVLSPHADFAGGLTLSLAERYSGDFSRFMAPSVRLSYDGAPEEGEQMADFLNDDFHIVARRYGECPLDHGSLVPLFFLKGSPRLVVANPIGLSPAEAFSLGQALAETRPGGSWGLLASGDLSHRVIPGAPAGYSPFGEKFDGMIVEAFENNDPGDLLSLGMREIGEAGECGLRSALVFLGLGANRSIRNLSYEAPFGVGYATAFASLHAAPSLARTVIEEGVRFGRKNALDAASKFASFPELKEEAACFVTLKTHSDADVDGSLRGCIGTILPSCATLLEEIAENALSAATRDPRFPPVRVEELDSISVSVDILSRPERVAGTESLDPGIFGVVVEKDGLRGVLLPNLDGVDRVEQQLSIAAQKAGIHSLDDARISRFSVHRIAEEERWR
ncbi:MAG: AmmeMemoRadiSam system protein A [Synergistaceae bacterium]|nr:AmmeMemoRadiSam system protein A [Synergistota bacterium]NLM70596.1 AmmeMemoRadiSam system protein A [Synergistaceae bacterium]